MITFRIYGTVREAETGVGLQGFFVKAYDKDLLFDDLLGTAYTEEDGHFEIISEPEDFRDFFDVKPDIYLKVFAPDAENLLYSTEKAVRWQAGRLEESDVLIPSDCLGDLSPTRTVRLLDDSYEERSDFSVGESVTVQVSGVRPGAVHDIVLLDADGTELLVDRVISNEEGTIEPTVVWPQLGFDDLQTDMRFTVERAQEMWGGRELTVQVREGSRILMESGFRISEVFERPLLLNTDHEEVVLNGFEVGTQDAIVSGYNMPFRGRLRVFMVPRQYNWAPGNSIEPLQLTSGRPAFADTEVGEDGRFKVHLASADELEPGAYDFVVRQLRYGYEDDDDLFLRTTDIVTRTVTGLVVREEFMVSKFAKGGCVNVLEIAGRKIDGAPYFQYANMFEVGEPIYGALDPLALKSGLVGKMVALYVIKDKTAAQWSDKKLQHLLQLGGNKNVQTFKVQSGCINFNKRLLWSNPKVTDIGEYEIVADFGKKATSAATFKPDGKLGKNDIIDGYTVAGFRIVPDPGTATDPNVAYVGKYSYTETDFPTGTGPGKSHRKVDDERNEYDASGKLTKTLKTTRTLPLRAAVRFPADKPGITSPSQISKKKSSYPMIVIVHGQGHHYEDYEYLLEHWARNGFIAASIYLGYGQTWGVARAYMLFEHLSVLKSKFGSYAANNIGIMGHSRGGEGVVTAARLNKQKTLGHNINAVISLAPTNQFTREILSGSWATPYLVIYGSMDGDVNGIGYGWYDWLKLTFKLGNSGFALYDRAGGQQKSMVFVYGATHNGFRAKGYDADKSWLTSAEWKKTISSTAHQKIALAYMTAFFRQHLKGEKEWHGIFRGEWIPSSVAKADGGKVKLYVQYSDTKRQEVDNFEGTHSLTSWKTSTIGGQVTHNGTLTNLKEDELYKIDVHSPHETGGLILKWDDTSDLLRFMIPPKYKNVRQAKYQALSFRIAQKVGGANPTNKAQDLYVTLKDGDTPSKSRSIKVSKFAEIPPPHSRDDYTFTDWTSGKKVTIKLTKSAMCTLRIPLHVFEIDVWGLDKVNLTNVKSLTFDFGVNAKGEIDIDSVEFTN